jgi:hypothetical protein
VTRQRRIKRVLSRGASYISFARVSIHGWVVRRLDVHPTKETAMRFMMIVKPPAYTGLPDPAQLEAMGRYNDELLRAGVLLDLNGLAPTTQGVRVQFSGTKRTVIDGPFAEAKEVIGGYWIIQVRSKEEAVEWAKRIPFSTEVHPGEQIEVEIRQIMELEDLPVSPERVAAKKQLEQSKR